MPQDPRLVKGVDEMIAAGDSDKDIALFVQQFKAKFPEKPGEGIRELGTGIKEGSEMLLTAGTPWEQIGGAIKDIAGNVRAGHGAEMNRVANKGFFTDVANATGLSTMWQGAQAIPDVYRHQAPKWAGGMGDPEVAAASKRGQSEGVAQAFKDVGSAVTGDPTRKDETYSRKVGRVGSMVGMLVAGSKVGGPKAGAKKPYVDLTPDVNPGFGGTIRPDTPSGLAGPMQGPVAPQGAQPRLPNPKGLGATPAEKIAQLLADEKNPAYAKVPFEVADEARQKGLRADYSQPTLENVDLDKLLATQNTITRDVATGKLGRERPTLTEPPIGSIGRPPTESGVPIVIRGADGKIYIGDGTHDLTASWAEGTKSRQAVVYPEKAAGAPSSHGPDATFHNNQSYDLKYSSDAQNAASKSKGRAMREHARQQADAPPQGMKANPGARPKMLTDAEIDASRLSDETFIEKGPGAAEDAVNERNYRRRIADERGAVKPKVAIPLGAAVTGGVVGSAMDEENPLLGALAGGAAGLGAVTLGSRLPKIFSKNVGTELADMQRGAMLTGPAIAKAALGAAGGVGSELIERGLSQSPVKTVKDLGKVIKSIPAGVKRAGRALGGEDTAQQAERHLAPTDPFWAKPAVRLMGASDAPAREALKALGLTDDAALSRVLSGAPKSATGKNFMDFLKKTPAVKHMFAPVGANTSVNVIEQGLQRLPGISFMKDVKAMDPTATTGRRLARTGLGAGAVLGGIAVDKNLPDSWSGNLAKGLINASLGPYAFPFAIGAAGSRGKDPTEAVNQALMGAQRELPLRPTAILTGQPIKETVKRFTPSIARQIMMAQEEARTPAKKSPAEARKLNRAKVTSTKLKRKKVNE